MTLASADAKAGNTVGHLTTKGEGQVYIGARIYYMAENATKNAYSDYSFSLFTVTAPQVLLTGISWNLPSEPFQLSHSYMLADYVLLEPANATYSGGLTYKLVSSDPKSICSVSSGKLTTRTTPGTAEISVTAGVIKYISATGEVTIALVNPFTSIEF